MVFCDSRKTVEDVAGRLREEDVETFVSHSSLAVGERRRAESAFAEARNCVIVSTSTLELGVDVGDLDRVLQVGAPGTVASVLQRLGRTGRRPETSRNMTFLALEDLQLLRATALLLLLEEGFVEPIEPPPMPLHIAAQQMLAVALQKGQTDLAAESRWLESLGLGSLDHLQQIASWLIETEHLDRDGGLAFVGPAAEKRYGRKNFLELLAVFSAPPEVTVLHGRDEVGSLDPMLLMMKVDGPRVVALGGRAWRVTHIDWKRRRAQVEPSDETGRAMWGGGVQAHSYELSQTIRRVLLGEAPSGARLSKRAAVRLESVRGDYAPRVTTDATVVRDEASGRRWWTFAGLAVNAVLSRALEDVAPHLLDDGTYDNFAVNLRGDAAPGEVARALRTACQRFGDDLSRVVPRIDDSALRQLKFNELLPPGLSGAPLARRVGRPCS